MRHILRSKLCQIIPGTYFRPKYIRLERTNQFDAYKAKSHLFQKPKNKTFTISFSKFEVRK